MPKIVYISSIFFAAAFLWVSVLVPAHAEPREAVLLSLAKPPSQSERDAFTNAGLELGIHLGRGQFLASVELGTRVSTIEKIGSVRSDAKISDLPLSIKLEPVLEGQEPSLLRSGEVANRLFDVNVTPAAGLEDEDVLNLLRPFDDSAVKATRAEGWNITVTGTQLFDLALQPGVAQIETETAFPIIK